MEENNQQNNTTQFNAQQEETTLHNLAQDGSYTSGGYTYSGPSQVPTGVKKGEDLAIVSLICGICSLLCWCRPGVLGIVAVVCGIISKDEYGRKSGMAIAGIVCGAIGTFTSIIGCVFWLVPAILGAMA